MIDVPDPFTLSVVYMTTDAMPSIILSKRSNDPLRSCKVQRGRAKSIDGASSDRSMLITRQWVHDFDKSDLRKFLALSLYYAQAQILRLHADEYLDTLEEFRLKKTRDRVFFHSFKPIFKMFASMVYVVDEGFRELNLEDVALNRIRVQVDMEKLRRFRNATFHFQPYISNPKHDEYIANVGAAPLYALHERQGFLIRRISRFAKDSPAALAAPTIGHFDI